MNHDTHDNDYTMIMHNWNTATDVPVDSVINTQCAGLFHVHTMTILWHHVLEHNKHNLYVLSLHCYTWYPHSSKKNPFFMIICDFHVADFNKLDPAYLCRFATTLATPSPLCAMIPSNAYA